MAPTRRRAPNIRLLSIGMVIAVAWAGVGFRLYDLQGPEAEEYAARGVEQRLRREVKAAPRGTIFDRNGAELAVTIDAVTVYADPREIDDPESVAALLAPLVGGDPDDIAERLSRDTPFVYVARQLERDEVDRVRASALPGIYFTPEPKRVYPNGGLAAQVLGFVQVDDNHGLEGLELQYDDVLTGTPGEVIVERDPYGRGIPLGEYSATPAEPGADLITTIHREIQFVAEQELARVVERYGAAGASAVVIEVTTGEVLAMANIPTFNPNRRTRADIGAFRNRAVTDVYEPGSTQKLITVAAAVEERIVRPVDAFEVPTELVVSDPEEDKVYEDIGSHPGRLTVADIVAYSSNIGTILIEQKLGDELFQAYLARFGLGKPTGIDFPGEVGGLLRPLHEWCPTTCGPSTAIGYGVSDTALQMAAVYAAIGNDGVWIQPHLVREIVGGDGSRRPVEPFTRAVVSPITAAEMRAMLAGVIEKGTGTRAAVEGYRVGGKTGTTQKIGPDASYGDEVVASFIGIAPIEDPRVAVAVVIDAPAGGEFGGIVAAPVFAAIIQASLHQLGVVGDAP